MAKEEMKKKNAPFVAFYDMRAVTFVLPDEMVDVSIAGYLVIFVYLSSLLVAHLSDAPRRRLVVTGDSARIQDETTENSAWFFNVLGV